jgi:2,4-dienoyl-CoA reductase-like NADH-dependent reductase (Old Yellow Enzyme family)
MHPATAALFTPFTLGNLTLANRIVMAPMTRNHSPDGVPGDDVVAYYRRRAEHGVGLIMTEGTVIDHPASSSSPRVPWFHGDAALAGWARVATAVHAAGGRIMPQLWHVGMARKPGSERRLDRPDSI